jgi:hypothetical protein
VRAFCRRIGVAIELLAGVARSLPRRRAPQAIYGSDGALGVALEPTGVRPKRICGGFPLLRLSRSSSTRSWVMSTCMAWIGVGLASLDPMSPSGAPSRAMPPVGSREVAMAERVGDCREGRRVSVTVSHRKDVKRNEAWREHPGTRQQALVRGWRGRPVTELLVCWLDLSGVRGRRNEQRTRCSEDGQTRSDCHSARWSGSNEHEHEHEH